MFLDPFIFTPPSPEALTRAVESYQRVAAARFCRYARDAEDPDLLPRRVTGETLEPTPKQLHAEVRALRHLTAIQRTLRELGGPLFDPTSPLSPQERFRLVDRRLDAIDQALGDDELGTPSTSSASFSLDSSVDDSAFRPLRLENSSSDFSQDDSPCSPRSSRLEGFSSSDFTSSESADKDAFYHPPEIEDLLEAVNFAQTVFAARAELLDKRRLILSPEDFLLEIASLRDLTAVVRTLRRMSAHRLPEDQTHENLRRELSGVEAPSGVRESPCSSVHDRETDDAEASPEPLPESFSASSLGAPSACSASFSEPATSPAEKQEAAPPLRHSSHPSHRSHTSHDFQSDPNPHPSHVSSESVQSVKSVDGSGSASGSAPAEGTSSRRAGPGNGAGLINSLGGDLRTRPVPRVPEVRTLTPRRDATLPTQPAPDTSTASPAFQPAESETGPPLTAPEGLTDEGDPSFRCLESFPSLGSFPSSSSTPDSDIPEPKSEIPNPAPSHPSHPSSPSSPSSPSDPSHASDPAPASEISNLKSEIPHPPPPAGSRLPAPSVLRDKDPPPDNPP